MKILILSGNGAFHIVERHARVGNRHRHRYASLEEKSPKGARCLDIVSTVPKSIAGRPPRNLVHVVVSLDPNVVVKRYSNSHQSEGHYDGSEHIRNSEGLSAS